MTKKESAEKILKQGHCDGIICRRCFLSEPCGGYYGCSTSFVARDSRFRMRVVAAEYLAELEEADD